MRRRRTTAACPVLGAALGSEALDVHEQHGVREQVLVHDAALEDLAFLGDDRASVDLSLRRAVTLMFELDEGRRVTMVG